MAATIGFVPVYLGATTTRSTRASAMTTGSYIVTDEGSPTLR